MNNYNKDVGTRIRLYLAEKNISRVDFAKEHGYPIRIFKKMYDGNYDFSIHDVVELERIMDTKLMLVPSVERVATISMSIDTDANMATVNMSITENGSEKTSWTTKELISTANALTFMVERLHKMALAQAIKDEQALM